MFLGQVVSCSSSTREANAPPGYVCTHTTSASGTAAAPLRCASRALAPTPRCGFPCTHSAGSAMQQPFFPGLASSWPVPSTPAYRAVLCREAAGDMIPFLSSLETRKKKFSGLPRSREKRTSEGCFTSCSQAPAFGELS